MLSIIQITLIHVHCAVLFAAIRTDCFAIFLVMAHNGNDYEIDYAEAEPYRRKTDNPVNRSEHFSFLKLAHIAAFAAFRNLMVLFVQLLDGLIGIFYDITTLPFSSIPTY